MSPVLYLVPIGVVCLIAVAYALGYRAGKQVGTARTWRQINQVCERTLDEVAQMSVGGPNASTKISRG